MGHAKRTFIFGAGFSKPAGMPLATELFPLLAQKLRLSEMRDWIDGLRQRLEWLSESDQREGSFVLNIEEVFHYVHFDIEVHRLRQHLSPVGRQDGPGTAWKVAESIEFWLMCLEDALRDVILEKQVQADPMPISRWAETVDAHDSVLTFNYDTLVERALAGAGKTWNHGTGREGDDGIAVFKLHGSIDWIVAHRREPLDRLDLLFDKPNTNRGKNDTGSVEDDCCLWRCRTPEQLQKWLSGRDLQMVPEARTVEDCWHRRTWSVQATAPDPRLGGRVDEGDAIAVRVRPRGSCRVLDVRFRDDGAVAVRRDCPAHAGMRATP